MSTNWSYNTLTVLGLQLGSGLTAGVAVGAERRPADVVTGFGRLTAGFGGGLLWLRG